MKDYYAITIPLGEEVRKVTQSESSSSFMTLRIKFDDLGPFSSSFGSAFIYFSVISLLKKKLQGSGNHTKRNFLMFLNDYVSLQAEITSRLIIFTPSTAALKFTQWSAEWLNLRSKVLLSPCLHSVCHVKSKNGSRSSFWCAIQL